MSNTTLVHVTYRSRNNQTLRTAPMPLFDVWAPEWQWNETGTDAHLLAIENAEVAH